MPLVPSTTVFRNMRTDESAKLEKCSECMYPPLLLQEIRNKVPKGFMMRPLKFSDYENGFLELLSQLTTVGEISHQRFVDRYYSMALSDPATYFVTVIEDRSTRKVIATATLALELKFIHTAGCRGRVEDVVVHCDYRGKGFARLLNEACILLAKKNKAYKISLECTDELMPFYEKFGYKKDVNFMVQRPEYEEGPLHL